MDALMKLPREVQVILGGLVLYVIFSFLDWQSYSIGPYSYGLNEWHGFGVFVSLVAIVTLAWEAARAFDIKLPSGSVTPELVSVALALALLVFTVIIFLDWSQFRAWPEYLGLVLSIVIGVLSFRRARAEGVEMPNLPKASVSAGAGAGTVTPAAPLAGTADEGAAGADSGPAAT